MSSLSAKVADRVGVPIDHVERLSGGDLSEVIRVRRADGQLSVAKANASSATEAAMLRAIVGTGVPAPIVEGEYDDLLLLEYVDNDGLFSARTWSDIGDQVARLHGKVGEQFGWPVDFSIGTVQLDNREGRNWPRFWGEQRLAAAVSVLDRPWRERVERLVGNLADHLPASPRPSFLHGDLWSGNMLVREGRLAALIDPACYYGHNEVDLAMICLFGVPEEIFWESYGALDPGWRERRPIYQLFPGLVHMRLFGTVYAPLVDRLLSEVGV